MCFDLVRGCQSPVCGLLKLCRTNAAPSGDFHLGPRDVVHNYMVAGNRDINNGQMQVSSGVSESVI